MIDIDKAAHDIAFNCAFNSKNTYPSPQEAWKGTAKIYYEAYNIIKNELLHQSELDKELDKN